MQPHALSNLSTIDCERDIGTSNLAQSSPQQAVQLSDSEPEHLKATKPNDRQQSQDEDINSLIDSMNASIAPVISPRARPYSSQLLNPEKAMIRINQQAKIQKIKNPVLRIALMATSSLQEQLTSEHPNFVFSLNGSTQANYNRYAPERSYIFEASLAKSNNAMSYGDSGPLAASRQ